MFSTAWKTAGGAFPPGGVVLTDFSQNRGFFSGGAEPIVGTDGAAVAPEE